MPAPIRNLILSLMSWCQPLVDKIDRWASPLFALGVRLYVADVFFRSGWLKLVDWDSTIALFESEYHVPVLPPEVAAALGTAGELGLSALLALGLAGRFGAIGLFALNAVAVISYPDLVELALKDHYLWGALLAMLAIYGPGRFSVDAWLCRTLGPAANDRG